jgi:hypothetical protein
MTEKPLLYNTTVQAYAIAQKITIHDLCNGITIKNLGNSLVIFDDEIIQPGASKAIAGNRKEIFVGRKDLSFQPTTNQPIPVVQPVPRVDFAYITQKFYVPRKPTEPGFIEDFQ